MPTDPDLTLLKASCGTPSKLLHSRRSYIIEQAAPRYDLTRLEDLDFVHNVSNSLLALYEYIKSMAQRKNYINTLSFCPGSALVRT
jgi:hypothetical protein